MALGGPAELAAAAGTGDEVARGRLVEEIHLDAENPVVADQAECFFGEFGVVLKDLGGILLGISRVARSNTEYDPKFLR